MCPLVLTAQPGHHSQLDTGYILTSVVCYVQSSRIESPPGLVSWVTTPCTESSRQIFYLCFMELPHLCLEPRVHSVLCPMVLLYAAFPSL